jgi:hypothetical protein
MRYVLLLLTAILLKGCSHSNTEPSLAGEVKVAQEKWESNKLTNYEYTYQALCFCAYIDSMIIVVENDSVTDVLNYASRESFTIQQGQQERPILDVYPSLFKTISEFYEKWDSVIPTAYMAEFEWDKRNGLPITVYIDGSEGIADDEITYNFSGLKID